MFGPWNTKWSSKRRQGHPFSLKTHGHWIGTNLLTRGVLILFLSHKILSPLIHKKPQLHKKLQHPHFDLIPILWALEDVSMPRARPHSLGMPKPQGDYLGRMESRGWASEGGRIWRWSWRKPYRKSRIGWRRSWWRWTASFEESLEWPERCKGWTKRERFSHKVYCSRQGLFLDYWW